MARQQDPSASARLAHDAIVALTDAFCQKHLNDECGALCRRLTAVLARIKLSPIAKGKPGTWGSGVVRVVGWVNFLDDRSQTPHLKLSDIDRGFEVSPATGQAKAMVIRKLLKIQPLDPEWTLPSRVGENPSALLIQGNSEGTQDAADENPLQEVSGTDISRASAADAAVLVGELHLRQGEYAKAIAAFTRALENGQTADAYQGRATAYRSLAELDEQKAREQASSP
jgi:hypothetical protein